MEQTPVSQMQQLVSHWTTLMMSKTKSKKRGRDEEDGRVTSKPKTRDVSPLAAQSGPAKSEMTRGPEPFAFSFS